MPLRSRIALRSPPAQKAVPAPVRMTQRTERSRFTRWTAATTSSQSWKVEMALRFSGAFRVSVTIGPSCSYFT